MPPDIKKTWENDQRFGREQCSCPNKIPNDGSDECKDAVNLAETENQQYGTVSGEKVGFIGHAVEYATEHPLETAAGLTVAVTFINKGSKWVRNHVFPGKKEERQVTDASSDSDKGSQKAKERAFLELIHLLAEASDMTDKKYPKE